ncbi:T9SS type A sorting domain-containing protein [Hugenholtzia roseola]|uniref:T9SS type A sorting domain-containing protein n=1 Tax=Hugenholtzia roseola TaxID=1002 RepID=UPI00041A706C|nr:T9SS type A sorting domain-containing protein [Hugenholtzia roseola]
MKLKRFFLTLFLSFFASFALQAQCPAGEEEIEVTINTDGFGDETYYRVFVDGVQVAAGNPNTLADNSAIVVHTDCYPIGAQVVVYVGDTFGDGIGGTDDVIVTADGVQIGTGDVAGVGGVVYVRSTCATGSRLLMVEIDGDGSTAAQNAYSLEVGGVVVASGAIGSLPNNLRLPIYIGCQTIGSIIDLEITDAGGNGIANGTSPDWIISMVNSGASCGDVIRQGEVTFGGGVLAPVIFQQPICPTGASSGDCIGKQPLCFANNAVTFITGIGAGDVNDALDGVDFGCLGSANGSPFTPATEEGNSAWFYFQIDQAGTINAQLTPTILVDFDFALWGPFPNPDVCGADLGAPIDCSFSAAAIENVDVLNAQVGEYYVLFINRFASAASPTFTMQQIGGAGLTNCAIIPCSVSLQGNNTICASTTSTVGTTLNALASPNAVDLTYTWLKNGVAIVDGVDADGMTLAGQGTPNLTIIAPATNVTISDVYSVEINSASFGCTAVAALPVSFVIPDQPSTVDLGADLERCDGDGNILLESFNDSHVGVEYQWFLNDVPIANTNSSQFVVPAPAAGFTAPIIRTYKVRVTQICGGQFDEDEVVVTYNPRPAFLAPDAAYFACEASGSFTINVGSELNLQPIQYQVFRNGVLEQTTTNPVLQIPFNTPEGVTTTIQDDIRVELTNTVTGCVTAAPLEFEINYNLAPIFDVLLDVENCDGTTFAPNILNYDNGEISFVWYKAETLATGIPLSTNREFFTDVYGEYIVKAIVTKAEYECEQMVSVMLTCPSDPIDTGAEPEPLPYRVVLAGTPASRSVELTWNAPEMENALKVAYYEVYYGGDRNISEVRVGTTTETNFTVTGLLNGVTYSFVVRPVFQLNVNNLRKGLFSNVVKFTPSIILGEDEASQQGFKLFPNPNQGQFQILFQDQNVGNATLEISNTAGQIIYRHNLKANQNSLSLDLSSFANGLYLVTLKTENGILQQKVSILK